MRERWLAWLMRHAMGAYERRVEPHKRELFAGFPPGRVLEIGCGVAPNRRFLPSGAQWIGADPNLHMRPMLCAAAEHLPFADASMDAVVCTLVLCSVRDVPRALSEARRVLAPGGTFYFLEHVAAPRGSKLRTLQHLMSPVCGLCAGGCDPLRDTEAAIRQAGFAVAKLRHFRLGFPHIAGQAKKL